MSVAREIARAIRSSSGGLRHVKAIGVEMKSRGLAQVSINLTDFEQTPLHLVFETVKREAERHGCAVVGSEIIGLIPRKAIELSSEDYLLLENFSPAQVLENRLAAVAGILPPLPANPAEPVATLRPLVEHIARGRSRVFRARFGRVTRGGVQPPNRKRPRTRGAPPSLIWKRPSPRPTFMSDWYNSKPCPRRLCC